MPQGFLWGSATAGHQIDENHIHSLMPRFGLVDVDFQTFKRTPKTQRRPLPRHHHQQRIRSKKYCAVI
jgi:beta-glucosidase/6-phospho-beta-glucosidase/beta-galactosidase